MAQSTSASDSENTASNSRVKGLAQIAIGAAAGAFIASRMNRGALLLTAGLAYSLWKKNQHEADPTDISGKDTDSTPPTPTTEEPAQEEQQEEAVTASDAVIAPAVMGLAPSAPQALPEAVPPGDHLPVAAPSALQPFLTFPVIEEPISSSEPIVEATPEPPPIPVQDEWISGSPSEASKIPSDNTETNAWAELRAALSPAYPTASNHTDLETHKLPTPQETPPANPFQHLLPEFKNSVSESVPQAPPMIDLSVCQPLSPLIHTPITEGIEIPDEIQLPEPEEVVTSQTEDFILDQPPDEHLPAPNNPPTKPITVIVPRQDIKLTPPASLASPAESGDAGTNSLTAPVVIPRDVQAKKSFFDWLRG